MLPLSGMAYIYIYIPRFMRILITDIQEILRFRFRNLRDCNIGITCGRDL